MQKHDKSFVSDAADPARRSALLKRLDMTRRLLWWFFLALAMAGGAVCFKIESALLVLLGSIAVVSLVGSASADLKIKMLLLSDCSKKD